ncbi:MAG: phospho-N-acetylmuramoyl-pentapeptide-transferase, partial [Actinomycetales bacterium]|nr:phospho-N-acetylmuramoyl-pentapeptide-transferase [Actinomycetales bacterium]
MSTLLLAGAISLVFTLFMTPVFIRVFRAVGWGQFTREDGPKEHHLKKGTPTMGGIVVILGVLIAYFLAVWVTGAIVEISSLLVLFLMVGLGVVGFIDDFIKTHKQRSLGLGG